MEKKYNIVFKGKLVLGYHIQDVRDALTAKFKLDGMALGKLFSGDPQIIKKGLDQDTAQKFLQMMEKIGARCAMEVYDPAQKTAARPAQKINRTSNGQFACPKCGHKQQKAEVCSRCGILISKYRTKDEPPAPEPVPEPEPEEPPAAEQESKEPEAAKAPKLSMTSFSNLLPGWSKWVAMGILWVVLLVVIFTVAVPSCREERKKSASGTKGKEPVAVREILTEDAVLKTVFATDFGDIRVGTAFITRLPDSIQYLLVTAQSVFGPRGGLPKEYTWNELPGIVKNVKALSIGNPSKMVMTNTWLLIPNAAPSRMDDATPDVAALYLISDFGMGYLSFSETVAAAGDKVFLMTEMPNRGKQFRFPAVVIGADEKIVQYAFEETNPDPGSVIGAPVLNAESKVVAINTVIISKGGELIGIGNPAAAVKLKLQNAMSQ